MKEIKLFLVVFAAILAAVSVLGISKAIFDLHRMQVQTQILREKAKEMERDNDATFAELGLPPPRLIQNMTVGEIESLRRATPTPNPRQ
jgi:hypothetical protein